ncbi:MAG: spermidine synthase, partial [Deltaproteobacteria bacterium]|nr:spermidine synthase [Deltaproteobacteria bacterium]
MVRLDSRFAAVAMIFLFSGAAGLIYQIVWMRKLGLVFGVTSQAVSVVLAVFMGGLSLGSWLLGRKVDASKNPLRFYAALELGIALTGAVSLYLIDYLVEAYVLLSKESLLSFNLQLPLRVLIAALVLGVPTTLMGGTLPAVVRAFTLHGRDIARS